MSNPTYIKDLPLKETVNDGDFLVVEDNNATHKTTKQILLNGISGGGVTDVKVNGVSIVSDGVANLPIYNGGVQ